jgi:hypothetical protein
LCKLGSILFVVHRYIISIRLLENRLNVLLDGKTKHPAVEAEFEKTYSGWLIHSVYDSFGLDNSCCLCFKRTFGNEKFYLLRLQA